MTARRGSTHILDAFDRMRVWQRGDQRAVHKPLLVLLALGRLVQGEPPMAEFSQLEPKLAALLGQFGPAGAGTTPQYPFWHLRTDGLWQLDGPENIVGRPPSAAPTLTELRRGHVKGGFPREVREALERSPPLIPELARRILAAHFPETLHGDILDAVGLAGCGEAPVTAPGSAPQRRDPAFREQVLRAYEFRCCVCGYDLRLRNQYAGLEAAHIKWVQAGGPDAVDNGLALCALHHKIFDLGVFTLLPDGYVIVFSQEMAGSPDITQRLLSYHGAAIIQPQSESYLPKHDFLEWHQKWVFKGPRRDL